MNTDIGNRIKYLRKSKGFLQKEIYDALQMDSSQYSKLEKTGKGLTLENFVLICEILECSSDEILSINVKAKSPSHAEAIEGDEKEAAVAETTSAEVLVNLRGLSKGQSLMLERLARIEDLLQVAGLNDDRMRALESVDKMDSNVSGTPDVRRKPRNIEQGSSGKK